MKRLCILLALAGALSAQPFQFDFKNLAQKAKESVDVNLTGSSLQFASKFLSEKDADEAKVKKMIAGLKGIYVRSFEFDQPGQYSESDVEALRAQVKGPNWNPIVNVRSSKDGENVDVLLRMEGDKVTGLAVISAEPKELTVVHIDGPIDPDMLGDLGGHFGIPRVPKPKPSTSIKPTK